MDESIVEIEAEKLFLKGAELEQNNDHCAAIRYYRKAIQLIPDIDVRVSKKSRLREFNRDKENHCHNGNEIAEVNCIIEDECTSSEWSESSFDKFQKSLTKPGEIFSFKRPSKTLHFLDLPEEIIVYILRWVVSDELDLRSLDQCALVCKSFYLLGRNPQIWKLACIRVWKNDKIKLENYNSWRNMFISSPRIGTNGCYIAETKYYRQGERSFQDTNYRPFHLVVYYRYMRFFADGSVLMINTPDTPNLVINQLKYKNSKYGAVIRGSYRIIEDNIFVTFKVNRMKKPNAKTSKTYYINLIYNMKFQIKIFKKWYSKLLWKEYKLSCPDESSYEEEFQIQEQLFPPLRFSVVKNYVAESERPLN